MHVDRFNVNVNVDAPTLITTTRHTLLVGMVERMCSQLILFTLVLPLTYGHGSYLDYSQYLTVKKSTDPDPTKHMQALLDYSIQNRNKSIAVCAAQSPPIPPAKCKGGVPFCALIVDRTNDTVVTQACNHASNNPVLHGEIAAINSFASILEQRGVDINTVARHHDLYTTGESCAMCMVCIFPVLFSHVPSIRFSQRKIFYQALKFTNDLSHCTSLYRTALKFLTPASL